MTAARSAPALAVVGATGAVGSALLQILSARADVWGDVRLIASSRSAGLRRAVRGEEVEVLPLTEDAFDGLGPGDAVVFLTPPEVSARWAPLAAARGPVVVDRSPAFRADPDVPLLVPDLTGAAPAADPVTAAPPHGTSAPRGIVAGPGPTALILLPALAALHAEYGLTGLQLSTYQAATGAGRSGAAALRRQLTLVEGAALGERPGDVRRAVGEDTGPFAAPLALNVVPWTGGPEADGWSAEELALRAELRRVLDLPALPVAVTCVQVPVITGHSVTVRARFGRQTTVDGAHAVLAAAPGVVLADDPAAGEFPTPADAAGTDPTWAGRVRRSLDDDHALEFFVCADDLRAGSALAALRTAELLTPGTASA
ncbi:aspartate-semialdehyde dehydrogenase [Streptomyces sp. NPDC097619]|uniref:aspartate-semialdehyde dehydrogenase n=1 Tax=Streptomyces sp. NPDC097619 TaxID=3157228 RepID=UPI00332FC263